MSDLTIASIVGLSEACPEEHLAAFVQANDRIFLNPTAVGNVTWPLSRQLEHYLKHGDRARSAPSLLSDIDHALRTGTVRGAAAGDEDTDSECDEDEIPIYWREDPLEAWAAALRAEARAARGCVVTADGNCFGPIPLVEWLQAERLSEALDLLRRAIDPSATVPEQQQKGQGVATDLANAIEVQLQSACPRVAVVCRLMARLVLVLHHLGGNRVPGQELPDENAHHRACGCAHAAAKWLAAEWRAAPHAVSQEHPEMLDELGGVGFIASLLVEQDAAHAMHEARLEASLGLSKIVGTDDDAWCGDEDGPERHAEALVHLAASTCAAASSMS